MPALHNPNTYTASSASNNPNLRGKSFWDDVPVTSMDPRDTERRKKLNFRVARLYTVFYADGDDEHLLDLIDEDCDWATLWGVVHGMTAIRVAIAEERRQGVRFLGPTNTAQSTAVTLKHTSTREGGEGDGASQAFHQATETLFDRDGWMREPSSGISALWNSARHRTLRESLVIRNGKIQSRVLQFTPKTIAYQVY